MSESHGPLPRVLAPLSWLAASAYRVVIAARNRRFDRGRGVRVLLIEGRRIPVISVGNITVGGTGKSPCVAWICGELAANGCKPVIAMRGYRGVRTAEGVIDSDEAREYAITAPDALVVVHRRRYEALVAQLSKPECREWIDRAVVVLDDGFQHRQLARDLDIVLVDGSPMQELLPHGWLREPASNIARADLVVRTKASVNAVAGSGVPKHFDAQCDHTWTQFEVHDANGTRVEQLEWLRSRSVMTACGLGNPAHFEQMARVHAGAVVHAIRVADHRALTHATLAAGITRARVNAGASQLVVLMTRKDFVKLDARLTLAVAVPTLALAWSSGVERMREAIRRVSSRPDARP